MRLIEKIKDKVYDYLYTFGFGKSISEEYSLTYDELAKISRVNPFSKYIVPEYYDQELGLYINSDNTIGYLFELTPVLFMGESSVISLHTMLKSSFPKDTVIQVICYADPNVEHILNSYYYSKRSDIDFLMESYKRLVSFYKNGLFGFPVRNFRVFLSVKFPIPKNIDVAFLKDLKNSVIESFRAAKIPISECPPSILVAFLRKLLNDSYGEDPLLSEGEVYRGEPFREFVYNELTPIRTQIVKSDTVIERRGKEIKVGNKTFRCFSPKELPTKLNYFFGNFITGLYDGPSADSMQSMSPFFIVFTVVLTDIKASLYTKANLILQQQAFGSFSVSLREKKEEYLEVLRQIENGEVFYPCYLFVWVYDEDLSRLESSYFKLKKLWNICNVEVQDEILINFPLFVYSLPFGFIYDKKQSIFLDREFILPGKTIASILPVQGDFYGTGEPSLLFIGRKGQVILLDLFSKYASSYNFFIAAPSGKGKSFFANYLLTNYFGQGAYLRVVDIGYSYKKLVELLGGKFIEFDPEREMCINFFEMVKDPDVDLPIVAEVLAEMASVNTGEMPEKISPETAFNVLKYVVNLVFRMKGNESTIDDVYEILRDFPKTFDDYDLLCEEKSQECYADFQLISKHLAFNLFKYTTFGPLGRFFNGKTTVDISSDRFVVLELDRIKNNKDLFNVVVFGVMLLIVKDLYLSDRQNPRLILFDEAWQFLQDTPVFQRLIEEGYRRARKYYGSFGIITQSVLDLDGFGRVGKVINANSSYKFYLESTDFRSAKELGLLPIKDDFIVQLLESVKYNAPKYSEIFVYTDHAGFGIIRLAVDKFTYYLYTTNPRDVTRIEELVRKGYSYKEAIEILCAEEK